jgi:hypothetical protein
MPYHTRIHHTRKPAWKTVVSRAKRARNNLLTLAAALRFLGDDFSKKHADEATGAADILTEWIETITENAHANTSSVKG